LREAVAPARPCARDIRASLHSTGSREAAGGSGAAFSLVALIRAVLGADPGGRTKVRPILLPAKLSLGRARESYLPWVSHPQVAFQIIAGGDST